jgi:predicted RNase H-like HicB family nuclease
MEDLMVKRIDGDTDAGAVWERVRRYAMVIEWSDEDQLFLVSIPDFPGAHTHGRTRTEAAAMGEEVIALLVDGEANPPAARFTAMAYPVRPEAGIRVPASATRSE